MRIVDLYHFVGVAALFIMVFCITLGANDGVVLVIGIGVIVILLLGVHLVLDKHDKALCAIDRKLEEIYYDAHFTKMQSEFGERIRLKEQSVIIESLANISIMINKIGLERENLSMEELKQMLEELKIKVDEISVNK